MRSFWLFGSTFCLLSAAALAAPSTCLNPGFPDIETPACQLEVSNAMKSNPQLVEELLLQQSAASATLDAARAEYKAASKAYEADRSANPALICGENEGDPVCKELTAKRTALQHAIGRLGGLNLVLANVDPKILVANFYVATSFSNLFGEPNNSGFFSKSQPFLSLELRQAVGGRNEVRLFTDINLQASSFETAVNGDVITTANNFAAETGVIWLPPPSVINIPAQFSVGPFFSGGLVGFAAAPGQPPNNEFGWRIKAGLYFIQQAGPLRFSMGEVCYYRDPLFQSMDRLYLRGRLVISPNLAGQVGRGLGAYLEGSANVGAGEDEAKIVVGIQLDALAILRAVIGVGGQ